MEIAAVSIFPEMFDGFFGNGMIRRAIQDEHVQARAVDLREYAEGVHKVTDDKPFGGGCGMVMKPEPLFRAIDDVTITMEDPMVIAMTPQGRPLDQNTAWELSRKKGLVFVCGRYEGIDERVYADRIDLELSIGDYVLTGGELPAMVVMDSVIRLIPGVLGGDDSAEKDSFAGDLLEHAQYTRPAAWQDMTVPEVLLSGNHAAIEKWRLESALKRTFLKRPDLLENRTFSKEEAAVLRKWSREIERILGS